MTNEYTFSTKNVNPAEGFEGYDYVDASQIITRVADSCLGRFYIDEQGNATYESRYALVAEEP